MHQNQTFQGDILGFLHVDPVRQAQNHGGDQEAHYNSNYQPGLIAVCLACNKSAKVNVRQTSTHVSVRHPRAEARPQRGREMLLCARNALMSEHIRTAHG